MRSFSSHLDRLYRSLKGISKIVIFSWVQESAAYRTTVSDRGFERAVDAAQAGPAKWLWVSVKSVFLEVS